MAPSVDDLVERAYKNIDSQSDYTIPKLGAWRKANKITGNGVSACQECGAPILHDKGRRVVQCQDCRKKTSDLFKKRKSKTFCKISTIETNL